MKFNIDIDGVWFVKEWSLKPIKDGRNFRQLFMIADNLSLYWLFESYLHTASGYMKNVREVMKEHNGEKIQKSFFKARLQTNLLKARFLARWAYSRFKRRDISKFKVYSVMWGERSNLKTIVDRYDKTIIVDYPDRSKQLGLKRLKQSNVVAFEFFFTTKDFVRTRSDKKRMQKLYYSLRNTEGWKDSFKYKDIDFWPVLKPHFDFFFKYRISHMIMDFHAARNMINKMNPLSKILLDGEIDPIGRSIISRAKLKEIRTIGVQHGIIQTVYPVYIHPKEDVQGKPSDCPLVDFMVVWGVYFYDLLKKNCYDKNSLKVLGNPRYDELVNLSYDKDDLAQDLGIPFATKSICLTTQPGHEKRNREILDNLIRTAPKDWHIIMNKHPNDNTKIDSHMVNVHEVKGRLFECLNFCKVLVTEYSTTALEAILLGKPVFIVDFGDEERIPFSKYNIVKNQPLKAGFDYGWKPREEDRQKFIDWFFNGADGLATKRVLELIKNV